MHAWSFTVVLVQVVDDAGRVGVLLPATLPKGARKGAPVATLVDEQAVRDRLGVAPAQVQRSWAVKRLEHVWLCS